VFFLFATKMALPPDLENTAKRYPMRDTILP